MEKSNYLVRESGVLGGTTVIVGTRIPAERLARLMEQGYTPENLKREFPHVEQKVLKGAVKEMAELTVCALNKA
jgi:uncharacterized protein (DUF433 family)